MPAYTKPLPRITTLDEPFWDACRRHELRLQKCGACGAFRNPPSPLCPECGAPERTWELVSGRGQIETWVVFHHLYFPGFADDLPYNVAMIRLAEGPMIIANVVGCQNEALRRGMAVSVQFDDVTEEITIPKFRPAEPES